MFRASVYLPVFLSIGLATAQRAPLAGPVEGFAFDAPARSFRSISGALGAAYLGSVLLGEFDFGSVAPRQNYAIAYRAGHCLLVSGLGSEQSATEAISDSCALPEGVAWSGDGTVAILYSRTQSWLQRVTGLPGQAVMGAPIRVSPLGGALSAVSADLRGARVFAAITGDSAGVYHVQDDQSLVPVLPLAKPIALAISDERHTLYALDGPGNQLYEVSLADLSSQSWPLSGLRDPVAVRPARDATHRQVIYIAGGGDQLLVAYDTASHQVITSIPLDFSPVVVDALGRHSFVLRSRVSDSDPLWPFTDTTEPTVYFVPATPPTASGGNAARNWEEGRYR
jgi:hypothetical protein